MAIITLCSDFGAQENKVCQCFHCFPIYLPWGDGTGCHDLHYFECWVLSQLFHSPLSLSSRGSLVPLHFLPLERYLRLLIFLLAILTPAWDSSSMTFHMIYSVFKLNRQDDNIQPGHTLSPILNQSFVLCPVLTVASWPAYKFPWRQVRWSGIPIF